MSKGGSAPSAPDPYASAEAQYLYGTQAANYNMGLNAVNQVTPYGSTTWTVNPSGVPQQSAYGGGKTVGSSQPAPYAAPTNSGGGMSQIDPISPTWNMIPQQLDNPSYGDASYQDQESQGESAPPPQQQTPYTPPGGFSGSAQANIGNAAAGLGGPPQYTETTTLSPNEQAILSGQEGVRNAQLYGLAPSVLNNANTALSLSMPNPNSLLSYQGQQLNALPQAQNLMNYAYGQQAALPDPSQFTQYGNQAQKAAYGVETAAMDPYWNQQQEQMDSQLRNAGATPGTPAYDNAMQALQANRSSAYNQAMNQAFGQGQIAQTTALQNILGEQGASQQALQQAIGNVGQEQQLQSAAQTGALGNIATEQSLPFNQMASLMGQQPTAGTSPTSPSASVSTPDIMSAFNNQYQGQLANYNAGVASTNAAEGDVASLASAYLMYLGMTASDRRLKKNLRLIGYTAVGIPVYLFRYIWEFGKRYHLGVMAQDVEHVLPEAVFKFWGVRFVAYALVR